MNLVLATWLIVTLFAAARWAKRTYFVAHARSQLSLNKELASVDFLSFLACPNDNQIRLFVLQFRA